MKVAKPSNKCVFGAKILETNGCGEIAVISVDRDGANLGPDFNLAEKLRKTVKCQSLLVVEFPQRKRQ